MPLSRNMLYLFIGVLAVAAGALSWRGNRKPTGVQFNIGPSGISIEKK